MKKHSINLIIFAFVSFAILTSCGGDEDTDNSNSVQPTVTDSITSCFNQTINGGIVNFNSSCSKLANEWQWDFGDGSTSIAENPVHEFDEPGNYNVTLKVTDNNGNSNTKTSQVNITQSCKTCTISVFVIDRWVTSSTDYCDTQQGVEEWCAISCAQGNCN